ncbi:MAG: nuclear transport factor 2 family protein, partial [Myxococcota bacterium]
MPDTLALLQAANSSLFVHGDLDTVETTFTPDYVVHLAAGRSLRGYDGIRAAITSTRRAFSGLSVPVD